MSDNKHGRGLGVRGYYIALIACCAVIGISGYVYYHNTAQAEPAQPDTPVAASQSVAGGEAAQPVADQSEPGTVDSAAPTSASPARLEARMPVDGQVISEYAMEVLSYNQTTRDWRVHSGVDIAAEAGTPVLAAADGTVYTVYDDASMGMTVVIRHDGGYTTTYSSLADSVSVSAGDSVTMGQAIGTVGSTALMETALGDHVHFAVTCDGEPVDPVAFVG